MKLVSIIVPVYNVKCYIKKCVESILNQTYSNIEVILIDDGSTDGSSLICDEFALLDDRIKVVHQKNQGQSVARNVGLKFAKGTYIYFLDSDDYIMHNTIEVCVDNMAKHDVDIIAFNALMQNKGEVSNFIKYHNDSKIYSGEDYLIRMIKNGTVATPVWIYFYKSELIRTLGITFPEGRVFEDDVWTPNILIHTDRVLYIDLYGYNYIIRENSTMTSNKQSVIKFKIHDKNCHELSQLKTLFKDKKNSSLFMDYLARMYMESVKYLNLNNPEELKLIDEKFISDNIYTWKSYIKHLIFKFSKKLYFKIKRV